MKISKLNKKIWDNGNDAFDPTSFQISNIRNHIKPVIFSSFNLSIHLAGKT